MTMLPYLIFCEFQLAGLLQYFNTGSANRSMEDSNVGHKGRAQKWQSLDRAT